MGLARMGSLGKEEVKWNDEEVWDAFGLMKSVLRIDIGTGTRGHSGGNPVGMVLFPNVIEVRFSGTMKREFIDAVLMPGSVFEDESKSNEKGKGVVKVREVAQLRTLHLDDLQEELNPPATPLATEFRRMGTLQRVTPERLGNTSRLGPCQPIQRLLTPALHERCRNLRRLSIRVYAMSERGTSDDELWTEWAIFIGEVKPREVVFDCDRKRKTHGRGGGSAMRFARIREARGRAAVANDRRFGETLLPVLRGGWEGLERVEIRGVGESMAKGVRVLEVSGVEVVFDQHNEAGYKCQ